MAAEKTPGEFEIIGKYLRPLAASEGQGLVDDVAWLADERKVVTKDVLVAGTHFLADDPPDLIARKALRTNISDVICKGAKPELYWLGLVLPRECSGAWIKKFAEGLGQDQAEFGCALAGGDTTRHAGEGPLVVAITMTGAMPDGSEPVSRAAAKPGDVIAVTGTIGDAGLGLAVRYGDLSIDPQTDKYLLERYHVPQPRAGFSPSLAGAAHAALDISDGLLADGGHIASASTVSIEIDLDKLPLSAAAQVWLSKQEDRAQALGFLASAGDDYEILLTVPEPKLKSLQQQAYSAGTQLTVIGHCVAGSGEIIAKVAGQKVSPPTAGYDHFR